MQKTPSLFKLLTTDYMAFMSVVFPMISWGIYVYFLLSKKGELPDSSLPIVFGAITVIALIVLIWRITLINSVFAEGIEVNGTIKRIYFYRDRGRVLFDYTFMGEKIDAGSMVMRNKRTIVLQPGMQVVVVVDQNHPKRALIRDLYL